MSPDTPTRDELFTPRDDDGDLKPQEIPTSVGTIIATPLTYGDVEQYFGSAAGMANADSEVVAAVLSAKVVDPDLSDITEDEVADLRPMLPAEILEGLMDVSGIDAQVEVDEVSA